MSQTLIDRTTITASAFAEQIGREAALTLDGSEAGVDYWYSGGVAPTTADSVKWDLGSSKNISQIIWTAIDSSPNFHPADVVIETSPDNSAWTQVGTAGSAQFDSGTFRFTATITLTAARYIRLRPSVNSGVAWVIREVYIYETVVAGTRTSLFFFGIA